MVSFPLYIWHEDNAVLEQPADYSASKRERRHAGAIRRLPVRQIVVVRLRSVNTQGCQHYTAVQECQLGPSKFVVLQTDFQFMDMSKLLEQLIAKQLIDNLTASGLLPGLQLAYRVHLTTETAVMKILSDILMVVDAGD